MGTDIEVLDQRVGLGWEGKHRGFAEPRFLSEEARPHHHPRVFRKIPSPLLSPQPSGIRIGWLEGHDISSLLLCFFALAQISCTYIP